MTWLGRLFRQNRVENDLDRELRDHIERQVSDYMGDGLTEAEARRRARLAFGGLDQVKELCRDARGTRVIEDLLQDTRYALRVLIKQPGFSIVAIVTLALGIGANVAIFSLIDAILLRPLPVAHSSDLVALIRLQGSNSSDHFSYPQVQLLQQTGLFSSLTGLNSDEFNVGLDDNLERVSGAWVTGSFYSTLELTPALGRLLVATDDQPGAPPVAVISDSFWASHFGRDPSVIGRSLHIEGVGVPIVGVTPAGFGGAIVGQASDITLTTNMRPLLQPESDGFLTETRWLAILARPAANLSSAQLRTQLATVWPPLLEATTPTSLSLASRKRALSITLDVRSGAGGVSPLRRVFGSALFASMALVTLVLLIACVNVANLLLSRATSRQREIALRLAVGASRARVVRQVLTESVLLAAAGAAIGVGVALAAGRALVRLVSDARTGAEGGAVVLHIDPDWRMFIFTAAIAATALIVFAVIPAFRTSTVQPGLALNVGSSRIAGGRGRLGASLVTLQVALSILLIASAGLFAQTLNNLRSYDRGFRQDDVIVIGVDHSRTGRSGPELAAFFDEIVASVHQVPGVRFASLSAITPLQGGGISQSAVVNGERKIEDVYYNNVGPEYLDALGTPVLLGRSFTQQDATLPDGVAIVNETFVRDYLQPGSPLGQRVQMRGFRMGGGTRELRIVGVVKDAVYETLRASAPATIYAPYVHWSPGSVTLVVHAPGSSAAVTSAIRADLQPRLNGRLLRVQTMTAQLESSIARERLMATIATVFGALALALAAIGLYGLLSYWVSGRTHEIGVRIALGAQRATVLALVIRDAMWLLAIGCIVGAAAAWGLARFVQGLVFGLPANDPTTLAGSIVVLVAAGLLAAWLPARRATRVDAMTALRAE